MSDSEFIFVTPKDTVDLVRIRKSLIGFWEPLGGRYTYLAPAPWDLQNRYPVNESIYQIDSMMSGKTGYTQKSLIEPEVNMIEKRGKSCANCSYHLSESDTCYKHNHSFDDHKSADYICSFWRNW
jgi:hypothetical protein